MMNDAKRGLESMLKRESTRVPMNETRRPCCAGCAEFNATGCPGGGPFCITPADAQTAINAELEAMRDRVLTLAVRELDGLTEAQRQAVATDAIAASITIDELRRTLSPAAPLEAVA